MIDAINQNCRYSYYVHGGWPKKYTPTRVFRVDWKNNQAIERNSTGAVKTANWLCDADIGKRFRSITSEEANEICKSWGHSFV